MKYFTRSTRVQHFVFHVKAIELRLGEKATQTNKNEYTVFHVRKKLSCFR